MVKVINRASKIESWVVRDLKSGKLLKHELLHYKIGSLGGRDAVFRVERCARRFKS